MHEALAPERHEIGVRVAPRAQRRRPLVGSVQVEGLLAHEDHCAIDATGDERRDLFRRHEDHRFVQQRQPLRVAPDDDERAALPQPAERHEVGLTEAVPESEHLPEQFMGLLGVT